jgi:hypothetical protein
MARVPGKIAYGSNPAAFKVQQIEISGLEGALPGAHQGVELFPFLFRYP